MAESPTTLKPRSRWRPQFSLLTLLLLTVFGASAVALYRDWAPWYVELVLQDTTSMATLSPDGTRVLVQDHSGEIRITDIATRAEIRIDEKSKGSIFMSPDQRYIFSASDGKTRILDSITGTQVGEFTAEQGYCFWVKFSEDGRQLASNLNGDVRVWSLPQGKLLEDWKSKQAGVRFNPIVDKERIIGPFFLNNEVIILSTVQADSGNFIRLRKLQGQSEIQIPEPVSGLDFKISRDGKQILGFKYYPVLLYLWDSTNGKLLISSKRAPNAGNYRIFWRPDMMDDGRIMIILYDKTLKVSENRLWVWNPSANTSLEIKAPTGDDEAIVSPDGSRIISYSTSDFTLMHLFDGRSGALLSNLDYNSYRNANRPNYLNEFSSDSSRFLCRANRDTTQVWRRHRPEYWWGIIVLPAFWTTLALFIALVWNTFRKPRAVSFV